MPDSDFPEGSLPAEPRPSIPGPTPIVLRSGDQQVSASFYDHVGGHDTFVRLTRAFYRGVAGDAPLRELYPEEDLAPAEERLLLFLEQYWGGPTTYGETRGHPRLRMRHAEFRITPAQRERWLTHMRHAVETLELAPLTEETLWAYLERAAYAMVNTLED